MKTLIMASALSIAFLAGSAHASVVDLTSTGNSGTINGAQFFQYSGTLPGSTGALGSFLKIQNGGVESGYNTNGTTQFNTGTTHAIKLSDIPLVNGFRQFALNINEVASGTNGLLSLDQVQLFVTGSATLTGYNTTTGTFATGAAKVYDMDTSTVDNWVQLSYNLSGTGASKADMLMYVPNANFANASAGSYIVLYSKFGVQGSGNNGLDSSDGAEEWSINNLTGVPVPVPVPAAAWLLGSGLIGLAGFARRRVTAKVA